MHRRLTGDVPWQRDDVDSEVWTDLALWPEVEAQSVPIACFRGRVVARVGDQGVNREKKRIVT